MQGLFRVLLGKKTRRVVYHEHPYEEDHAWQGLESERHNELLLAIQGECACVVDPKGKLRFSVSLSLDQDVGMILAVRPVTSVS